MEQAADAFKQALQAQTDTLLAIALIVGFVALAAIIWKLVGTKQNKINIPSDTPGEPDKSMTKDEFIIQMFTDYRKQLEIANQFKQESMTLSIQLAERLKQADAANEKLAGLLESLSTQFTTSSREQAEALILLHKAIAAGVAQAISIRDETVTEVINHVDSKLVEVDKVRQALIDSLHTSEERISKMTEEIRSGDSKLVEKLGEVVDSLSALTLVVSELAQANKDSLKSNREIVDRITGSLSDIQTQLVEILSEVITTHSKEKDRGPATQTQDVLGVADAATDHRTDPGTSALPADDGPASGSPIVQDPTMASSGHPPVDSSPGSNLSSSDAPGPVLRPPEGSTSGDGSGTA